MLAIFRGLRQMNTAALSESAPEVKESSEVKLEEQLREAVRNVMSATSVTQQELAKVQEILDRKAALMRAPYSAKVRRIKESA